MAQVWKVQDLFHIILLLSGCRSALSCYSWSTELLDYSGDIRSGKFQTLDHMKDNITTHTCALHASAGVRLDLSQNDIDTIPSSFFNSIPSTCLAKIKHLDLSHNMLQALPVGVFEELRCLTTLNVSFNNISLLNVGILPSSVEVLDISHNELERIDRSTFAGLNSLSQVNASHNLLSAVETRVFNESNRYVSSVDFSFNRISAFEPWPYFFDPTVVVNLSYNKISRFTNSANLTMTSREMLRAKVDLQHNNLSRFRLDEISAYFNGRRPNALELGNLAFQLTNNPWICDCQFFWLVNILRTSLVKEYDGVHNLLSCDTPRHLHGKMLGYLIERPHLLVCNVSQDCPTGCTCQDRPYSGYILVDCDPSRRVYTQLPARLPQDKLLYLNLSRHQLHELHQAPNYVSRLYGLDVSRNTLTDLSSSFLEAATSLVQLNVSDNKLTTFPGNIRRLSLENIQLRGNPLVCSCGFLWFGEWFSATHSAANVSSPAETSSTTPPQRDELNSGKDIDALLRQNDMVPSSSPSPSSAAGSSQKIDPLPCKTEDGEELLVVDMSVSRLGCRRLTIGLLVGGGCVLLVTVFVMVVSWRWRYQVTVIVHYWFCGRAGRCVGPHKDQDPNAANADGRMVGIAHQNAAVNGAAANGYDMYSTHRYDVYVSMDEEDEQVFDLVKKVLLPLLEGRQKLRVYLPLRQELPGACKAESRVDALLSSHSALILISHNYAQNGWCRFEFDHACRHLEQNMAAGNLVLLVIAATGDNNNDDDNHPHHHHHDNDDRNPVAELSKFRECDGHVETLEPLRTFLVDRRYLGLRDRFMKQKLVYELSRKRKKEEGKDYTAEV